MSKLIENVRHRSLVCVVVHEDDDPLFGQNERRQDRPIPQSHGNIRRLVKIRSKARVLNGVDVILNRAKVRIDEEQCDDIIRVVLHPLSDLLQIGLQGSNVKEIARCVTAVNSVVHPMGFAREHSDAVI